MPSTFGQWLIVILALLVGLAGGWLLWGRQAAASTAAPIVEGDPVAGAAEVSAPATATVDHERPEAVVDEVPPAAAVTEAPAPDEYQAAPAAATLAADAAPLPGGDTEGAEEPQRVDAAEGATAEPAPAEVDATPVVETEPVRVEERETPVVAEAEPTDRPATVAAEQESAEVAPATIPAPRAAVEDDVPAVAAADTSVAATPVASNGTAAAASNGSAATAAADDFRRIQGIGPKMAAALQAAGIRTYHQLAELDEAALRETIKAAGLRAAPSLATWSQQAKLLAGARAEADRVLPVGAGEDA